MLIARVPDEGSSYQGRTVDALASRADEGRGKTAKSPGELSSKLNRGSPNGATRPALWRVTSGSTHRPEGGHRGN